MGLFAGRTFSSQHRPLPTIAAQSVLRAARASQTATDLRVGGAIIMASVQSRRGLTGPSGARSEVTVVETKSGRILLVLSPRTEETTKIVEVDHTSGVLLPQPKDMVQEFKAHNEALEYLSGMSDSIKTSESGSAILGFVVLAGWVLVLIARRTRVSMVLPGGHEVHTVTDSKWFRIPLNGFDRTRVSRDEMKNLNTVTEFAIEGVHFYCETLDVSCPFPGRAGSDFCTEFVWNEWLGQPFWRAGMHQYCPRLFQGFAESMDLKDSNGTPFSYAHFCRRSRQHPGTRYLARGINANAGCGNEIECELLLWRPGSGDGASHKYASYVWRRGSVPIWWGVDIRNTVGEAEIWVKQNDSYEHTARYFRRLRRQYTREGDGTGSFSVTCVNLLRCAPGRSELKLSEGFQKGVRSANKMIQNMDLRVLNFDWHANTKALGEKGTIKGLWMSINNMLREVGFNSGSVTLVEDSDGTKAFEFSRETVQKGVLRYNCADSLDRTNVASFFGVVPVLLQQCRVLDLDLIERQKGEDSEGDLPEGWEARTDQVTGKKFYIDHVNRRTTWSSPAVPLQAMEALATAGDGRGDWWVLDGEVDGVREAVSTKVLGSLMEQFKVEGDLNAMLYTGSRAMHSAILQQILPPDRHVKSKSGIDSALLSVKRRYLNLVHDGHRQQQMEMFLGISICRYFPTLNSHNPYEYISMRADPESDVEEDAAEPAQKETGGHGASDGASLMPGGSMELKETEDLVKGTETAPELDDLIDFGVTA